MMKHLIQIDHVGIQAENPRVLFDFFSQTLGLPVVFDYAQYPNYTSGSVSLGNMFLELMRFDAPNQTKELHSRYQILGFLIESGTMADCLQELDGRQVPHSGVLPFFSPDATDENPIRLWDNAYIGSILGVNVWQKLFMSMTKNMSPKPSAQQSPLLNSLAVKLLSMSFTQGMPVLTEYHQRIDMHRAAIDGSMLRGVEGGKLHIQGVQEIVIGTSEHEASVWARLSGSNTQATNSIYTFPQGPRLRLAANEPTEIKALTLKVTSLAQAREIAEADKIQWIATGKHMQLSVPGGASIELVE